MEGLIPLVYKRIKGNRTRRQYECLSSGAAQTHNIAEFYSDDISEKHGNMAPPWKAGGFSAEDNMHRRHKSFHVDYPGTFSAEDSAKIKQLVRFRSCRMFSCITGA